MGFFDLNIPYHESDRRVIDTSSLKGRRLKLALKAMELGFTGIAYNRTLKGVMSESDRCSTNIFPLSKLAASSSSSFVAAVKFHRELLNINVSSPFRQYTRLTVIADYPAQLSALKAGNPVLKSYDIVAVRPMSKETFEQACQTSEVDMIVIDFSENLPFTLRQPVVKAAIKRGIYFEITYSGLISDAQSRRRVISNSKLLVDWTRGQNLIISSAARSTTELRGPQDVANLFSLLALPMDRAKAAISKNCRSLLTNALRKRHFYKEAVKVEKLPLDQVNPEKSAFDDWLKWDPISSGEGDLLLEDMEKSFAISNNVKETVKTIDFTASLNGLPAHGLQIKDLLPVTDTSLKQPITDSSVSAAMEIDENAALERPVVQGDLNFSLEKQSTRGTLSKEQGRVIVPECQASYSGVTHLQLSSASQDFKFLSHGVFEDKAALSSPQNQVRTPISDAHIRCEASDLEESALSSLPPNGAGTCFDETLLISIQKANSTDLKSKVLVSETESHGSPSFVYGGHILPGDGQVHTTKINGPITDDHADVEYHNLAYKSSPPAFQLEQTNVENQCEDFIHHAQENVAVEKVPKKIYCEIDEGKPMASPGTSPQNALVVGEHFDVINKSVTLGGGLPVEGSLNINTNSKEPILVGVTRDRNGIDSVPNYQGPGEFQSGRGRRQSSLHKSLLFPFKRFLSPRLSKKKSRKLKKATN